MAQAPAETEAINAFQLSDAHLGALATGQWEPKRPVDFVVENEHGVVVKLRCYPDGTYEEFSLDA